MTSDLALEEPDTSSIRVWAVGTGTWDRSYFEDIFEKYGVALVGCDGVEKKYTPDLEEDSDFTGLGRNRKASIRTIGTRIKRGDLILARSGRSAILGLGVVCGKRDHEYDLRTEWARIQGWDLYHQVRVDWLEVEGIGAGRQKDVAEISGAAFSSGYSVQEVKDPKIKAWALGHGGTRSIEVRSSEAESDILPELPEARQELEEAEMPEWFKAASRSSRDLMDAWHWDCISESSIVAHVVVPMLHDLGWDRTQIKLEEHWVDVQVEDGEGSPVLLIEAKAPRFGISAARRQAVGYWEKGRGEGWWGDANPWLMATNGNSFTLESPEDPDSRLEANLLMPTKGAKDFIRALQRLAPR